MQKQDPHLCCLQETHFRPRDAYRLKLKGWKKIFHVNGKQKKAGVAILISDKIDFKECYKRQRSERVTGRKGLQMEETNYKCQNFFLLYTKFKGFS